LKKSEYHFNKARSLLNFRFPFTLKIFAKNYEKDLKPNEYAAAEKEAHLL
jgi:hypothetical protein